MIKELPAIGLGTYLMKDKELLKGSIEAALKADYKHIDTAQAYDNEHLIGEILEELRIDREKIFITSKTHPFNFKYHTTETTLDSMNKLKTSYLDLVLLHVAVEPETNAIAYKELMKLRDEGKIKHIGVSNMTVEMIEALKEDTGEYPYVNQIKLSPLHRATGIENFCKDKGILLTGYSIMIPYFEPGVLKESLSDEQKKYLEELATKYKKDVGQIHNKWALQNGYYVIPKSKTPTRVATNNKLMDFKLSESEMKEINSWNEIDESKYVKDQNSWSGEISEEKYKVGRK